MSIVGVTLDTGALIALERKHSRMAVLWRAVTQEDITVTVPTVVVAEWWRAQSRARGSLLRSVHVEPLSLHLAQLAGEAMTAVPGSTVVDAVVVASAAQRGDVIYTSDFEDLDRLRAYFTAVPLVRRV